MKKSKNYIVCSGYTFLTLKEKYFKSLSKAQAFKNKEKAAGKRVEIYQHIPGFGREVVLS